MNLDQQIDDVARRMTTTESSGRLSATMAGRLDEQASAKPLGAWLVIAASISIVAFAVTSRLIHPHETTSPMKIAQAPVTSDTRRAEPSTAVAASGRIGRDATHRDRPSEIVDSADQLLPQSEWIAPLETPEPIAVQPNDIAIPLLHMQPIETTPVSIAPIPAVVPLVAAG